MTFFTLTTKSEEETKKVAASFGKSLNPNTVLCLFGELGAGKTTFVKGLVRGAARYPEERVSSPTYTYLNIYEGEKTVYHFDLYRLEGSRDFLEMGFDEYLSAGGITCMEWSERLADLLPDDFVKVVIEHAGGDKRDIQSTHRLEP